MMLLAPLHSNVKLGSPQTSKNDLLPSVKNKYIVKVVAYQSPYLDKGMMVTKKFLNPEWEKSQMIALPEIRKQKKRKAQEEQERARSNSPNPQTRSPYIAESAKQPSPYSLVKSKYLVDLERGSSQQSRTRSKIIYYFYDCNLGNNGIIIKKCLDGRPWWKDRHVFKSFKPEANFVWSMGNWAYNYEQLTIDNARHEGDYRCINRLQQGFEINDKDNLFRNLWHHTKANPLEMLEYVPLTFSFRVEEANFERDLQEFARFFLSLKKGVALSEVKPITVRKDCNGVEYNEYYRFKNNFRSGTVAKEFRNYKPEEIPMNKCLFGEQNLWMVKPSGLNRGKGLELFTDLDELDEYLRIFSEGYDVVEFANMDYNDQDNISPTKKALLNKDKKRKTPLVYKNSDWNTQINTFVIQKYIERPLLFYERKFDLRVFVLYTHLHDLFVFTEAYVRLSSLPYDPTRKNYLIHLTNNAVQVRSDSYGSVVKGNIVSIRELEETVIREQQQLGDKDKRPRISQGSFMNRIKEIVKITFDSTNSILQKPRRKFAFELFGYDFMIDENLSTWLIEANSVPSLGESNLYITKFMYRALEDMLKLTIDKIFPKPADSLPQQNRTTELPPYPNDRNLWDFVANYS